jgi:hypothetical protein
MSRLDLHCISKHEPVGKLPMYTLRKNIILIWAHIDFYYAQKKKFAAISNWQTDGFDPGTLWYLLDEMFTKMWSHLVKNKEFHDVLHVLFDYDENPEWEALLQGFMLGNRTTWDYTYPFLLATTLLLPETLGNIYRAYKKWQEYIDVRHFNFHDHLGTQKEELLTMLKK